jgi:NAD(P)-dependent dehydrogenase (short-subunit alcohol dehydrogenase family)
LAYLDGKVALITGGSAGLGKAVAKLYMKQGASVGIVGRSMKRLIEAKKDIGGDPLLLEGDVSCSRDNERFVKEMIDRHGKLDIFVGNAGLYDGNKPLREIPIERFDTAFDDIFHVNVKGYLLGAAATYPELLKTCGCMIFSASHASFYSAGGGALYTASKHAIAGIIKQLAFEFAPKIRVNGVAPGAVATDMGMPESLGEHIPSIISGVEKALPLQFIPDPEDYAGLYLALAADDFSKTMTGSIIQADTGIGIRGLSKTAGGLDL